MSDLLRWFGEQSEAVKLALIAGVGGFFGAVLAVVKEWRKPVLASQPAVTTTANAPRSADDPVLLLLHEVSAINIGLAQLLAVMKSQGEDRDKIDDLITDLTNELYLLRSVISNKTIGM